MTKDIKISNIQLTFFIISFTFGSKVFIAPAIQAKQDAWLALLISWVIGFIFLGIYLIIYKLNPGLTLVEILKVRFGSIFGTIIAVFYLWFFFHSASITYRNFGEFLTTTSYFETPVLFLMSFGAIALIYILKKGVEVVARVNEIIMPALFILVLFVFISLIPQFNINNLKPVMEKGMSPIFEAILSITTISYGQIVIFMMIFPLVDEERHIFRSTFISIFVIGVLLLLILLQDILVLGPDLAYRHLFPTVVAARLVFIDIDPIIAVNYLIGGSTKLTVGFIGTLLGIAQLLRLDDYKELVSPVVVLSIALSIWLFEDIMGLMDWMTGIYPYFALPFQLFIPLILLVLSLINSKKS